jgi:hypothetical protein
MKREYLLAAELFAYSYDNYEDHLGVGNNRFERTMPEEAELLERAEKEGWADERVAARLNVELHEVPNWRKRFRDALAVVDAPNPAEAFRRGVRFSILDAVETGLGDEKSIEELVTQICYRAADLSNLLKKENLPLSDYSEILRREPDEELVDE